jgi:hypothetical protein
MVILPFYKNYVTCCGVNTFSFLIPYSSRLLENTLIVYYEDTIKVEILLEDSLVSILDNNVYYLVTVTDVPNVDSYSVILNNTAIMYGKFIQRS